jgi:phenylalanine-4-hydroxylase
MKQTHYVAREPDAQGFIHYPPEEHAVWNTLITRQLKVIEGRACQEYLDGIDKLGLPHDRIPQLGEINKVLAATTGWQVARVPALIPFQTFFELLANKQFPVATFIRTREELDYLQEPDIFHEIFGHCPLLTNPWFAEFTHTYGKLGLAATKEQRVYLARLYDHRVRPCGHTPRPAHLRWRHFVVAQGDGVQPVRRTRAPGLRPTGSDAHAISHRHTATLVLRAARAQAPV